MERVASEHAYRELAQLGVVHTEDFVSRRSTETKEGNVVHPPADERLWCERAHARQLTGRILLPRVISRTVTTNE